MLIVFTVGSTYLITRDLVPTLTRKIGLNLLDSTIEKISWLEEGFLADYWSLFEPVFFGVGVQSLDASLALGNKIKKNEALVSLDRVYIPQADYFLEVTRNTDPQTGEVVIGPRPGFAQIEEQISTIEEEEIILGDVGAYSGNTLLCVAQLLEQSGINVKEIQVAYSSFDAAIRLSRDFLFSCMEAYDFYGWTELRDLFGIDGRRVKDKEGFIPYWENLRNWSPVSEARLDEASKLCKQYNAQLLELLDKDGCDVGAIGPLLLYAGDTR